jgi:hypothetical protein
MEVTVPFLKVAIDPAYLPPMRAAFEKVCHVLRLRCQVDDPIADLVLMFIAKHALTGELDPDRLCELTLRDFASHQVDVGPPQTPPTLH